MTISLYPEIIHEGDLSPDAVGPKIDEKIRKISEACKGFGTDELHLIKALAYCTPHERVQVATRYEEVQGKNLKKVLKSECGNSDFGRALQLLAVGPDETECDIIKAACKGLGTDELLLYPVICGRTNTEIDILKKKFYKASDAFPSESNRSIFFVDWILHLRSILSPSIVVRRRSR